MRLRPSHEASLLGIHVGPDWESQAKIVMMCGSETAFRTLKPDEVLIVTRNVVADGDGA